MGKPADEEIFARDGFRCQYCDYDGRDFEKWAFLQIDHFKPRCLGGTDEPGNLVTSCIICNHMKGATEWKNIDEARKEISKYWKGMKEYWDLHVAKLIEKNP